MTMQIATGNIRGSSVTDRFAPKKRYIVCVTCNKAIQIRKSQACSYICDLFCVFLLADKSLFQKFATTYLNPDPEKIFNTKNIQQL